LPSNKYDWKKWIGKKTVFPYKNGINSPEYKKDRKKIEIKHGNGWWCNDGKGWSMDYETPMLYHRRKRKERGLK
tara:strand:- start:129 stop:350 length:222 start_codon:yes stop_codon:yes gene_type:complete